ncbi:MAG: TetR/AcrR family transcriptional regulator [Streptosporangiaceae bacterium]
MATERVADHQRAIAERNVDAILDAVEELLERRAHTTMSAVAKRAGVSRVTLYAHFATWEAVLEAAVTRAVDRTMAALRAAEPDEGPADEAADRMIAAAWQHLARFGAMAQAVAEQMSPEAVARTHHAAHHTIGALVERGQREGRFRTDLSAGWLVTACIALIHTCADEVRAGRIEDNDAVRILTATVRSIFTYPGQRTSALPLEGALHVLAGVLDLLADLTRPAADPLALAFSLKVRIAGGPAHILLGVALAHLETVPELVHETHGMSPPIGAAGTRCSRSYCSAAPHSASHSKGYA